MNNRLNHRVQTYLCDHQVATLATRSDDDLWAAAVFYVNDGFTLYFLSAPTSRHCLNLASNSRVAVTIQEDYVDWQEIKGVQIEGVACEISGAEEGKARRLYGEKFPIVGKLSLAPAAIVKALAKVRWYKVVPNRLYFIDNSVNMGHRDEVNLGLPPSPGAQV
jgi:uncharacterized protein YhbP (UPF0306 family)